MMYTTEDVGVRKKIVFLAQHKIHFTLIRDVNIMEKVKDRKKNPKTSEIGMTQEIFSQL